jgi:hypothetical protein
VGNAERRVTVQLRANSLEANPRISENTPHFFGGFIYSAELRSSAPADDGQLLTAIREVDPSSTRTAQRLIAEFAKYEQPLLDWIERSPTNAEWFASDPLGAISAAPLGASQEFLQELRKFSAALATRIKGAN